MQRRPWRSTLFPYTTLFRSIKIAEREDDLAARHIVRPAQHQAHPVMKFADRGHEFRIPVAWKSSVKFRVRDRWIATRERSEEHTSELQSQFHLVCRLLLEKQ